MFGNALCNIFLKNRPFSDFENQHFQYLLNINVKRIDFTEVLRNIEQKLRTQIKNILIKLPYVSIMADEWQSLANDKYM